MLTVVFYINILTEMEFTCPHKRTMIYLNEEWGDFDNWGNRLVPDNLGQKYLCEKMEITDTELKTLK